MRYGFERALFVCRVVVGEAYATATIIATLNRSTPHRSTAELPHRSIALVIGAWVQWLTLCEIPVTRSCAPHNRTSRHHRGPDPLPTRRQTPCKGLHRLNPRREMKTRRNSRWMQSHHRVWSSWMGSRSWALVVTLTLRILKARGYWCQMPQSHVGYHDRFPHATGTWGERNNRTDRRA
jgi:hypothetical protein